jgi:hypothetical protein
MSDVHVDPLSEPPLAGSEIEHLLGALNRQRWTFRWKVDGLEAADLVGLLAEQDAAEEGQFGLDSVLVALEEQCRLPAGQLAFGYSHGFAAELHTPGSSRKPATGTRRCRVAVAHRAPPEVCVARDMRRES